MPRRLGHGLRSWTVLLPTIGFLCSLVIWIGYSQRASIGSIRLRVWQSKQARTASQQWGYLYEPEHPMALRPEGLVSEEVESQLKQKQSEGVIDSELYSELYFTYLPKGGLTNQMMELWKAIIIAKRLGRTLIYPPMLASLHDIGKHTQDWSDYFDMDYLLSHFPQTKMIKMDEAPRGLLPDKWTLIRKDNVIPLGMTARRLCQLYSWDCESNWISLELQDTPFLDKYIEAVENVSGGKESKDVPTPFEKIGKGRIGRLIPYSRTKGDKDKVVVVTPLLKVRSPTDWTDVGKYMRFNERVVSMAKEKIQGLIGNHEFISVHWRRADFYEYCQAFSPAQQKRCWPSVEDGMEMVMEIRRLELKSMKKSQRSRMKSLPIVITTNTVDEHELDVFRKLDDVHVLTHDEISDLGVFGKAMVDACVPTLSNARIFIGNSFSTFSKMATKRRQSWGKYGSRRGKGATWREMPGRVVYF